MDRYPLEDDIQQDDDGTMPDNVETLRQAVVGHRIVKTEEREVKDRWGYKTNAFVITLDNKCEVRLADTDDCCAYTALEEFLLHPDKVDHIITGVGTTEEYTQWHIYADLGDVLQLTVGWSAGNVGYYGYGFEINVIELGDNDG